MAVAIRDALVTANKPAEIAKEVTEFALSLMGRSRVADMLKKERVRRMPRSIEIVIHIDEAHSMGDQFNDFIKVLHAHGVGCPCVAVFTGLGQTAGRIREIKGMSRLSEEAVVNMGAMEREECIESTSNMLGRVGAAGDHEDAASRIATLAFGWPRQVTNSNPQWEARIVNPLHDTKYVIPAFLGRLACWLACVFSRRARCYSPCAHD